MTGAIIWAYIREIFVRGCMYRRAEKKFLIRHRLLFTLAAPVLYIRDEIFNASLARVTPSCAMK